MQVTLVALRNIQHKYTIYVESNSTDYYLRNGHIQLTQPQEVVFEELSDEEFRQNALQAIERERQVLQQSMERDLKRLEEQQTELSSEPPKR